MRCGFQLNRRLGGGVDTAAVRVEVEGGEGSVGDRQSHFFRLAAILLLRRWMML